MNSNQIRQQFLSFYIARSHQIVPTEPLIAKSPDLTERTNLWTLPFHPISLGQRTSPSTYSTNLQKYISPNLTVLTERHLTFFEKLGNCGDYSLEQAIIWAWELCTEIYQLPPSRLVVSIPLNDTETFAIWRDRIGIPEHQIVFSNYSFWRTHPGGHSGGCVRIHYDRYPERGYQSIELEPDIQYYSKNKEYYDNPDIISHVLDDEDLRFTCFYRLVLMEFDTGKFGTQRTPLAKKYIDAGMYVEQLAAILQSASNLYEIDLVFPIIQTVAQLAGIDYHQADNWAKINLKAIADHLRAAIHLTADYHKILPNLPRQIHTLIRIWLLRIVWHGQMLGIERPFIELPIAIAIDLEESFYPLLRQEQTKITTFLQKQESNWWKQLENEQEKGIISGSFLYQLFHTYKCYIQDIRRWADYHGLELDLAAYRAMLGPEID